MVRGGNISFQSAYRAVSSLRGLLGWVGSGCLLVFYMVCMYFMFYGVSKWGVGALSPLVPFMWGFSA